MFELDEQQKNYVIVGLLLAVLVLIGGTFYFYQNQSCSETGKLTTEKIGKKTMSYVNANLLPEGKKASLKNVVSTSSLYKLTVKVQGQTTTLSVSNDGKWMFPSFPPGYNLDKEFNRPSSQDSQSNDSEQVTKKGQTIGNFSVSEDEVCKKEEKPAVYFFGSESCPHCSWEYPLVKEVMSKFEGKVSFHDNMGNQQKDRSVFQKYSTGGVPTLVLGCKYYRVGSGESLGKEKEKRVLTALTCKLTGGQPSATCNGVSDLIKQVNE